MKRSRINRLFILNAALGISSLAGCRHPGNADRDFEISAAAFYQINSEESKRLTAELNSVGPPDGAYFDILAAHHAVTSGVAAFLYENKEAIARLSPGVRRKLAADLQNKYGYDFSMEPLITELNR